MESGKRFWKSRIATVSGDRTRKRWMDRKGGRPSQVLGGGPRREKYFDYNWFEDWAKLPLVLYRIAWGARKRRGQRRALSPSWNKKTGLCPKSVRAKKGKVSKHEENFLVLPPMERRCLWAKLRRTQLPPNKRNKTGGTTTTTLFRGGGEGGG